MISPTTTNRRGTIYILVLMTSVIITLIGILGYRMVQGQARVARIDAQRDNAIALAESAVQWGIHYVTLSDDWRKVAKSGQVIRTMDLGQGQISVILFDPDGDLNNDDTDGIAVVGTGTIGDASQMLSCVLKPGAAAPHVTLNRSLTVGDRISVDPNVLWLESGGMAKEQRKKNGHRYLLFKPVQEEDPVDLPNEDLIDLWAAMGTSIPFAMHRGKIYGQVMSKSQAPFGLTPDPDGIYVIDADDKDLLIEDCRTTGTIIVVNLKGKKLNVKGSRFQMGDHGGPSLITDGETILELGAMVGDCTGIIYCDGNMEIKKYMGLGGTLIVTKDLYVDSTLVNIYDDPAAVDGPPEGFGDMSLMGAVEGSWIRVVN